MRIERRTGPVFVRDMAAPHHTYKARTHCSWQKEKKKKSRSTSAATCLGNADRALIPFHYGQKCKAAQEGGEPSLQRSARCTILTPWDNKQKKIKSSSTPLGSTTSGTSTVHAQAQAAKKRAGLKDKASARRKGDSTPGDNVLGGADYVSLLLGGRKKAKEEGGKLPKA